MKAPPGSSTRHPAPSRLTAVTRVPRWNRTPCAGVHRLHRPAHGRAELAGQRRLLRLDDVDFGARRPEGGGDFKADEPGADDGQPGSWCQPGAQPAGVLAGAQRQRAGDPPGRGAGGRHPGRDDQLVVAQHPAAGQPDLPTAGVKRHRRVAQVPVRAERAQRLRRPQQRAPRRRVVRVRQGQVALRQRRAVVARLGLGVHHGEGAVVAARAQCLGRVQPGERAADNQHVPCRHQNVTMLRANELEPSSVKARPTSSSGSRRADQLGQLQPAGHGRSPRSAAGPWPAPRRRPRQPSSCRLAVNRRASKRQGGPGRRDAHHDALAAHPGQAERRGGELGTADHLENDVRAVRLDLPRPPRPRPRARQRYAWRRSRGPGPASPHGVNRDDLGRPGDPRRLDDVGTHAAAADDRHGVARLDLGDVRARRPRR